MLPKHHLRLLIDYMGGFPGALATLLEVLHNSKDAGKSFTFEVVLREVVSELQVAYSSNGANLSSMIEAFLTVIRRDDVTSLTKFGDASFDDAFSCGLLRLNVDGRLECPYVLYLLLDSLPNRWDELENHAPRELRGDWKPWVTWNEFYSTLRVFKSFAWAGRKDHMGWWQLHRGAYMTYSCQQWVKESRRSIAPSIATTLQLCGGGSELYARVL
ncbi:hypothetical protein Poli38472_001847 [Pythium oligandrum]|uniref:Uncharacterized protein n=1 Tax=Pythium oligandrum TaxID=41045 RepID=A0A8K1FNR9_PYTOL|nr:hypothetical protein Poli38472_001847 [Pythium oligandrum]|eukprot:TMW69691.1 hypothetical protein Poli38472_001847 [Pythium oligandrum]